MSTSELIDTAVRFDNGDSSVTIDQYDDAIEQLVEMSEGGDSEASTFLDSLN